MNWFACTIDGDQSPETEEGELGVRIQTFTLSLVATTKLGKAPLKQRLPQSKLPLHIVLAERRVEQDEAGHRFHVPVVEPSTSGKFSHLKKSGS